MDLYFFVFLIIPIICGVQANFPSCNSLNNDSIVINSAAVPNGFCPFFWAVNLDAPRTVNVMENGDVLVLESGINQVTVLWDDNANGISDEWERAKLASAVGINHGVAIYGNFLYASSPTQVFRWKYNLGDRQNLGSGKVVITGIPCCHHMTRTILFDSQGRLLVQSGSGSNEDPDSTHARIVRFDLSKPFPISWSDGEVIVDGTRNEVALRFDWQGRLWGVENGVDDLFRDDLGGDIHKNNPSEEMNLFANLSPGQFYGYPYCWSQYNLTVNGINIPGTQRVHDNFMDDGIHSDAWCQNKKNVIPPVYNFGAHMAPLDIIFSYNQTYFPSDFQNGAFVSFHGSWDRQPRAGYRVDYVTFDEQTQLPVSSAPFLANAGPNAVGPNWPHRPVGLAFLPCVFGKCLLVTSDASDCIMAVGYSSS